MNAKYNVCAKNLKKKELFLRLSYSASKIVINEYLRREYCHC